MDGLKPWMWVSKRVHLNPYLVLFKIFGRVGVDLQTKCQQVHRFNAFRAAFPQEKFTYQPTMPIIDRIDCKRKRSTRFFPFVPSMFNKSSTAGNLAVFEDLNIIQMGLDKGDAWWRDTLTLWLGDLKTANHMLGLQIQEVGMDYPYNRYKYLFSGLAPWHLRFNYLKMIWELFYPGRSSIEHSTLQWAADHWH